MSYIKKVDDDLLLKLEKFHGALVPGLLIGAYMVELAYEKLGDVKFIDAVVETKKCVVDAVQVMTNCTVGNGWLEVYDWGRFALSLYDKESKNGVRTRLDIDKIPKESIIYKWFFKEIGKDSHSEVNKEVLKLKKYILSYEYVTVASKEKKKTQIKLCKKCKEPFPSYNGDECVSCKEGIMYYQAMLKD